MHKIKRNQPPPEIVNLMQESVDIKLYLLHQRGPLSLTFQDEGKVKYHVNIGLQISCSCNNRREHCVHTIYTLNRIFKISYNNPLIFQNSYTDSELEKIIEMKSRARNTSHNTKPDKKMIANIENTNRMNLFDDVSCPICQEDMYSNEGLYFCSNSCGHNFHLNCLKVWAEHKKDVSDCISCPMCRAQWDESLLKKSIIKNQEERKDQIKTHNGIDCANCSRRNIKGERYHCLNCSSYDICYECYTNFKQRNEFTKHPETHRFILKANGSDGKWTGCEVTSLSSLTSLTSKSNKIAMKSLNLTEYLISLMNDKVEDGLNMEPCVICKSSKISSLSINKLKCLPCSHSVHIKCMENIFKFYPSMTVEGENFNRCPVDSMLIFPGLAIIKFNSKVTQPNVKNQSKITSAVKKQKDIEDIKSDLIGLALNIRRITFDNAVNQYPQSSKNIKRKLHKPLNKVTKPVSVIKKEKVVLPQLDIKSNAKYDTFLKVIDLKKVDFKVTSLI